jgi:hypothetical protein
MSICKNSLSEFSAVASKNAPVPRYSTYPTLGYWCSS